MNLTFQIETNPSVVTKLNEPVQNFHAEAHPEIFLKYDYERMLPWFEKRMAADEVTILAVYDQGQAIGYAMLLDKTIPSDNPYVHPNIVSMFIDQMSIMPAYQNQGVGAQLMDYIRNYCRALGANKIELTVWADNEQAIHFYKKMGFEVNLQKMYLSL